ncbi:poly(R)-hydroxyalkanoic acid synthase subunit PhaE [Methylopila sp. M107]|uniref:poly(R)-hydroxyalkanoic acid synthase subunit PhaE n=1 Tax=Methylopila sp. M107 TaxID=1101190 RepID=UPI000365FB27|nr:poly(R)-hydroxyalkanoic acid synthase subunit PhaE [Methylopila sp. M107]
MSDPHDNQPDFSQLFLLMTEQWRTTMEKSGEIGKLWSESSMPFLGARSADGSLFAAAQGGEITEAIKRMVEGPRLADMQHFDRELYAVMAAWLELRQRMAAYQANASVPWNKAFERYGAAVAASGAQGGDKEFDWRKAFAAWSEIANEELLRNQRSEAFLTAQRDLLRSALELRTRQQAVADSVGKLFGFPTQQDFDELTRQFTELKRELRAHVRSQRAAAATPAQPPEDGQSPPPPAIGKSGRAPIAASRRSAASTVRRRKP